MIYDNSDPWGAEGGSSAKPDAEESKGQSWETADYARTERRPRRSRGRRGTEGGRRGESRGRWRGPSSTREESKGQPWKSREPRQEEPSADPWTAEESHKEESRGQSWEATDYSHTDRHPRGSRSRRGHGEERKFKPRHDHDEEPRETSEHHEESHDHPHEERKRSYKDTPRKKGPKRGEFEKVKIKRRRFFENSHGKEVLYREEDEQFDPETHSAQTHFRANKDWDELPIPQNLLAAIEQAGFPFPSKIQNFGIEVILKEGYENLLAQAPNGSGKTATFVIGSLCRVDINNPQTQVICINHTIELANQNFQEYKRFADPCGISVSVLSKGGERIDGQVLVASSGSFFKALKTKSINLEGLKVLVMDEADHILNKKDNLENFKKIEDFIKTGFPRDQVQVLLFSATYTDSVKTDIVQLLGNLNEITIKKEDLMLDTIDHYYFRTPQSTKIDTFEQILRKITSGVSIAFVNTCNFARTVYGVVSKKEWKCALLMGQDMTVDERNLTMNDFTEGKYATLITTNLLARGIDNTKVKCVVNFDLPRIPKSRDIDDVLYLHRSGRCSRFGRHGVCISLVTTDEELATLKTLEDSYNMEIAEVRSLDDFDAIVGGGEKAAEEAVKDL
ncbi:unnamed protein product [Blepharisma stoltei]|uniref:ATP-dependent RNA helicase n=1 Tax=Blepharisma stoltei TaxID=1481888 RepID=A0AAU9ISJ9_9CILI|nr:unnamed protein product [Blepharisma stoltei]